MTHAKRIEDLPLVLPGQCDLDTWARYEAAKREIAETAQSAEEYERRLAELVEEMGV